MKNVVIKDADGKLKVVRADQVASLGTQATVAASSASVSQKKSRPAKRRQRFTRNGAAPKRTAEKKSEKNVAVTPTQISELKDFIDRKKEAAAPLDTVAEKKGPITLADLGTEKLRKEEKTLVEEIAAHENVPQQSIQHELNQGLKDEIAAYVAERNIELPQEKLSSFYKLLFTAIKGIRNDFDTRKIMKKSFEKGGYQLEDHVIKNLFGFIREKRSQFTKKQSLAQTMVLNNNVAKKQQTMVQKATAPVKKKAVKEGLEKVRAAYTQEESAAESILNNLIQQNKGDIQPVENNDAQPTKSVAQKVQEERNKPQKPGNIVRLEKPEPVKFERTTAGGKRLTDVVDPKTAQAQYGRTVESRSRLVGPVDELRLMTVIDFRRVADNIDERIQKIEEKIHLLEAENYLQRIAGVQAWQSSPVYTEYVRIGQEALQQQKPLKQIFDEMQAAGKDTLTQEEFLAITQLNRNMRY